MTWPEPYPDLDADERTTLTQRLDHVREGMLVRLRSLAIDEALTYAHPATTMTVGGIVRHLGAVEDRWFHYRLGGNPMPEPWASESNDGDPEGSMKVRDRSSIEAIASLYVDAATAAVP